MVRARVFYLFHRFIKDGKNGIPPEIALSLIGGIRDLLTIQVELPELEDPDQQDLLTEAIKNPGIFESQLYMFEAVGTLVNILYRNPEEQVSLLQAIVKPLLDELSINLQSSTKGTRDVLAIVRLHHIIMALGNIAKGFPDYPSPVPEGYIGPPLDVFRQVAQAILVCLGAMNVFKAVRDAVSKQLSIAVCALPPCSLSSCLDPICLFSNHSDLRIQRYPFHLRAYG